MMRFGALLAAHAYGEIMVCDHAGCHEGGPSNHHDGGPDPGRRRTPAPTPVPTPNPTPDAEGWRRVQARGVCSKVLEQSKASLRECQQSAYPPKGRTRFTISWNSQA